MHTHRGSRRNFIICFQISAAKFNNLGKLGKAHVGTAINQNNTIKNTAA